MTSGIINYICDQYGISNYSINEDMSVSVDGDVFLYKMDLIEIPIKFKKVSGYFDCSCNGLTSLINSPIEVLGSFNCSNNNLRSLKHCPEYVGGNFQCINNKNGLSSLKNCPKYVGKDFLCGYNKLTSLEGIGSIDGHLVCDGNDLTSFRGCHDLICNIYCHRNNITSFEGLSEFFEQTINLSNNPLDEIYSLFKDPRCIYYLKEYDVIRNMTIVQDRLEEVFYTLNMEVPNYFNLKNYKLV